MHAIVQQLICEFSFLDYVFSIKMEPSSDIYIQKSAKFQTQNIYYDPLHINNKMHCMRQDVVCGNLPNMTSSFVRYTIWFVNFMGKVDRFSFMLICIFCQLLFSCYDKTDISRNMAVRPLWCMQNSRASLFLSCRQA